MREAWGCESQSFSTIRIKHAITNKFVWQEPHKFICDGCTFGAQIVPAGQFVYVLVKPMLLQSFFSLFIRLS